MNEHVRDPRPDARMSEAEFEAAIRAVGAERYHDKHPFHKLLHNGKLNKGQVQAWALNRYCYQTGVPRKDAALMSRAHDREFRREWVHRIYDHDGLGEEHGGIERWLVLTDALGLDRAYVTSMEGALPATRFAVEAYVRFVVEQPLTVAVASSLTELFAPSIHKERIAGMLENYAFVNDNVMAYFKRRPTQAPRDAAFALEYVKKNAATPQEQEACVDAVRFKCNTLWAQLDSLHQPMSTRRLSLRARSSQNNGKRIGSTPPPLRLSLSAKETATRGRGRPLPAGPGSPGR